MVDYNTEDISPSAHIDQRYQGTAPEFSTTRRLMVALLDMSGSMAEAPVSDSDDARPAIAILTEALRKYLIVDLANDASLGQNGELAIAGFWGLQRFSWIPLGTPVRERSHVHWVRYVSEYMREMEKDAPFNLVAKGGTPLGLALNSALDVIEERVREWHSRGKRAAHRPIVVVLTDGAPTDMYDDSGRMVPGFARAIQRVHTHEANKDLLLWVACAGASADVQKLQPLADKGNLIPLAGKSIGTFITLMGLSPVVASDSDRKTAVECYADMLRLWDKMES